MIVNDIQLEDLENSNQQQRPPLNPDVHLSEETSEDEEEDENPYLEEQSFLPRIYSQFFDIPIDPKVLNEQFKTTNRKKLVMIRVFIVFAILSEILSLISNIDHLMNPESQTQLIIESMKWIIVLTVCGCIIMSLVQKNQSYVYPCVALVLIEILIKQYDQGTINDRLKQYGHIIFLVDKNHFLATQIVFNFIFSKKISVPISSLTIFIALFGSVYSCRYDLETSTFNIDFNLKKQLLRLYIENAISLLLVAVILKVAELEIIKAWNLRDIMHQELVGILDNLEEAIITKNGDRIGLCNEPGNQILWKIQSSSKFKTYFSSNVESNASLQCEIKQEIAEERKTLRARVFKLFQDKEVQIRDNETQKSRNSISVQMLEDTDDTLYSLNQIFKWDIKELGSKIFTIHFSENKKPEEEPEKKYYQIKRQKIWNGKNYYFILQIIDISNQILFNRANGEKKLLSLINATVSHEMRNPLNSIYSQNLKQSQICEKFKEIIDSSMPMKKMKKALKSLRIDQLESIKIQSSSTKILTFLVNDMLDFAQLRSGKFRKDLFNFDIHEAIQEIVNLQKLKAEFCGINLTLEMHNFPLKEGNNQIISSSIIDPQLFDFVICSDLQRVQQVVLNLLSNALKFTFSGGFVKVVVTNIRHESDLTHEEHHKYYNQSNGHGMIQISMQDSGVGIKKEDQNKLFKLFGFLDASKELNAKGVGLGLHISQRITQQFGGKIIIDSQIDEGSAFTFVIDLEQKSHSQNTLNRHQNPIKKSYQKIVISPNKICKKAAKVSLETLKKSIQRSRTTGESGSSPPIEPQRPKKRVTFALVNDSFSSVEQSLHGILINLNRKQQIGHTFPLPEKEYLETTQEILYTDPETPFVCQKCIDRALEELSSTESEPEISEEIQPAIRNTSVDLRSGDLLQKKLAPKRTITSNFDSNFILPKRILIVDDEPYNLLGLKIVIDAADKNGGMVSSLIDEATNGQEAYQAVKKAFQEGKFQYGLIFMDCSMPIMDGYEATEKIRKFIKQNYSPQPMIVACTGHSENEYVKKAWRHQMDEVVAKPANIEVISEILKEVIQYQK